MSIMLHYCRMKLSNIAILNIHSADCRFIISRISTSKPVDLMQNINLNGKDGTL